MNQSLPRFNAAMERLEDERKLGRILLEGGPLDTPATVARATLPGDTRRLRGIPAIGRGVSGHIKDTNPSGVLW